MQSLSVQREKFLVALLTFRAAYFVLPLLLAMLALGLRRELRMLTATHVDNR